MNPYPTQQPNPFDNKSGDRNQWLFPAALGVGAAAALTTGWIIKKRIRHKRVAILGASAVGKTHLATYLSTGKNLTIKERTKGSKKWSKRTIKIRDLELVISEGVDVSSMAESRAEWRKEFDSADIVLYLLRADLINQDDAREIEKIKSDTQYIRDWMMELGELNKNPIKKSRNWFRGSDISPKTVIIVGTHCDKDSKFKLSDYATYYKEFVAKKEVRDCIIRCRQANVTLGSMDTLEHTQELVYDIFKISAHL